MADEWELAQLHASSFILRIPPHFQTFEMSINSRQLGFHKNPIVDNFYFLVSTS